MHPLLALALALPLSAASPAPDTTVAFLIRVVDRVTEQPIEGARVFLNTATDSAHVTDETGALTIESQPPGAYTLRVEHDTYNPVSHQLEAQPYARIEVELLIVPRGVVDSAAVRTDIVNAAMLLGGYYERKARSRGAFIEPRGQANWRTLSQLVERVPRVRAVGIGVTRAVRIRDGDRACVPELYVDGEYVYYTDGVVDRFVTPALIEAVEVYRGVETPKEFHSGIDPTTSTIRRTPLMACGAIVVWTRR